MRKALLLAIPMMVLACDREPVAPISRNDVAANFMNNPDNGNPQIIRFSGSVWWIAWNDGRYQAWHITGPGNAGMDPAQCWDGNFYFTDEQMVAQNPSEWWTDIVNAHDIGTLYVVVLDRAQPGPCRNKAIVARGPASFRAQTNNALPVWYDVPIDAQRSATMSFESEGNLTTPTGETVRYNGHLHGTLSPDGEWKSWNTQIIVR